MLPHDKIIIMKLVLNKLIILILLLLGHCCFSDYTVAQTSDFSKLVVFGDSLSDTGNLAAIDLPPPFFENRISNGPVAVDFIAQAIGSNADRSDHLLGLNDGGFNYAVAGGNILGTDPEDLGQQVTAFLDRVNQQADADALYVVIIGGNDLRGLRSITDPEVASTRISALISQLALQLNELNSAGARAFLVANVANVGRIPETRNLLAEDPNIAIRVEQYVRQYNAALSQLLSEFEQTEGIAVVEFDLFQALEDILDNANSLGFTNIEQGCFDSGDFSIEFECLVLGFDSRVFFDNIHPSARTYEIIAPQIIAAIPSLPELSNPNNPFIMVPILPLLLED